MCLGFFCLEWRLEAAMTRKSGFQPRRVHAVEITLLPDRPVVSGVLVDLSRTEALPRMQQ
jgi:hypothetical protein